MPIIVACPECSSQLSAPESALGRQVKCPKCGTAFAINTPANGASSSSAGLRSSKADPPPPAPKVAQLEDEEEAPSRGRRPRREDEEDESPTRARRRRHEDDDDFDEDDRPRSRRRRSGAREEGGTGLQIGLGVAGLVLGIIGLLFSFIPCLGIFVALPFGGIGLVLALVGLIVALVRKEGLGFPIAGTAVSIGGIAASLIMWFVVASWFRNTGSQLQANAMNQIEIAKQAQEQARQEQIRRPQEQARQNVVRGPIILQMNGQLTNADPKDQKRPTSVCKVFTVNLLAGKTYWIDMSSPNNQIDSYLRLESSTGMQLAQDDDGGGFPSARIIFPCQTAGAYRVIATTFVGAPVRSS